MKTAQAAAENVVRACLSYLSSRDFELAVRAIDKDALEMFRDEWEEVAAGFAARSVPEHLHDAANADFGPHDPDSVRQLSADKLLAFFWREQSRRNPEAFAGLVGSRILGSIEEGPSRVYVLLRHGEDVNSWIPVSVVPVNRTDDRWCIVLNDVLLTPGGMTARVL